MLWYTARRLLQMVPVFLGATFLIYFLVFALPGDPIAALGGDRGLPPAVEEQIRERYNLDEPFLVQYLLYLKGILTFDFGVTFSGRDVIDVMREALPVTIRLAVMALVFEAVVGIAAGLVAGLRKGGIFDATVLVMSLLVIAVPTFVIGFVLQFVVGVQWELLPTTAGRDPTFRSLLMPAVVLGAVSLAYVLRLTRTSVAENMSADHVRTAYAKGLPRGRVINVHILRNSMIPVVTYLGQDLGALMGGAMITEQIFNIHGVGFLTYQSILKGEANMVVSVVTLLTLVFVVCNLLVDLLYAALDPRIRYA